MTGRPAIVAEEVAFGYGRGRDVLRGLSLSVASGEVVGLLGRNGSGKTTLLRLLCGLARPGAGRVRIDPGAGRPAVVLDRTPFLDPLDGGENLGTILRLRGRSRAEIAGAGDAWLEVFDLDAFAGQPVGEYSLGMRRRLALAEAFAADSRLLLLDEPTLGLDPEGRVVLVDRLRAATAAGAAAVVATNDAEFAERTCDRVLLLHRGSIAAAGRPGDLVAALDAPTVVHLELASGPPGDDPPAGFVVLTAGAESITLRSPAGAAAVEALWPWLERSGSRLRALRIREPGLADVFAARTGEPLGVGLDEDLP